MSKVLQRGVERSRFLVNDNQGIPAEVVDAEELGHCWRLSKGCEELSEIAEAGLYVAKTGLSLLSQSNDEYEEPIHYWVRGILGRPASIQGRQ